MQTTLKEKECGASLVEFLLVFLLTGLLSVLAVSSYSSLVQSMRIYTAASELHASLLYARSESIKHGMSVVICRSSTADSSNPRCDDDNSDSNSNSGWGDGWIIYQDLNGDGKFSDKDKILKLQGRLFSNPQQGSIIPNPKRKYIKFNSLGQVYGTYLQFAITRSNQNSSSDVARYICIASGGRARVDKVQCNAK